MDLVFAALLVWIFVILFLRHQLAVEKLLVCTKV